MTPTTTELRALFRRWGYDRAQFPAGIQAQLLRALIGVYEDVGILRLEEPRALCDTCPHARACWAGAPRGVRRRGPVGDGSLMLPWVGRDYEPGRDVVIVGINANIAAEHTTDPLLEHGIVWNQIIPGLEEGSDTPDGSRFHYGATRSAAALTDLVDGHAIGDHPPQRLVPYIHRVARLQAIKCVPRRKAAEPLGPMWRHCPGLLLLRELDVLRPRAILTFGADPRWAVWRLEGFKERARSPRDLWRGTLQREDWTAAVYGLHHPSAPGGVGDRSERALIASARRARAM